MLVKRFPVAAGTTILGAAFKNNDPRTVFPEVLLVRGVMDALSEGTTVARATNVSETASGTVSVTWSQPVRATQSEDYYIGVRMPAGPGKQGRGDGPALGALDVAQPNGSFLAGGAEGELSPVSVDLEVSLLTVAVGKAAPALEPTETAPLRTFLAAGTPNPATVIARIRFGVEQRSQVKLGIYDVAGRRVRRLAEGPIDAGVYSLEWDGRDDGGRRVAAGVYMAKLESNGKLITQKLVLTR
jgi:hypothetical protein